MLLLSGDSSAISTGVVVILSAVTTPVRASVQTGEPRNLAREGDPIGLTAEAGGFARPNHGLTTVVTGHGLRYPEEISENSPKVFQKILEPEVFRQDARLAEGFPRREVQEPVLCVVCPR